MDKLEFPKNFYWGTSTSSHQVEGNNKKNDWWRAEQEGKIRYKSGRACDSYNRYEEDFDIAKELGTNAHRLSIEWSRIEPEEGRFDKKEMEHYKKVIKTLRARGLEPFVTLHHFTNPVWFADKGGWLNKKAPFYFARYAEYVVKNLGDEVRYWVTINEANVYAGNSYIYGAWPPFKNSRFSSAKVLRTLALAHKKTYYKIKKTDNDSMVGAATSIKYFWPHERKFLARIVTPLFNYIVNFWFLHRIKKEQDFIGLNYYYPTSIRPKLSSPMNWMGRMGGNELSDFANVPAFEHVGWEIYPEGIYNVTKEVWKKYKKPIYITENGVADADDDQRPDFIRDHLKWLYRAIEEGADVRGYFHWSLLDNFEWAEGYKMKFGLVEVDFKTLKRTPRDSYYVYKKICETNSLN